MLEYIKYFTRREILNLVLINAWTFVIIFFYLMCDPPTGNPTPILHHTQKIIKD